MKVKNEEEAWRLIEELRSNPIKAQCHDLRLAIENLELDQMYYEQKGNDQGIQRCQICLDLLGRRLNELK